MRSFNTSKHIQTQNQFVMHQLVQAKKTGIGGAGGDCYWE